MKKLNGETYYICLGSVEDIEKPIDGKDIVPIFVKNINGTNVYVNDSDKDHVYMLPLIPVNDIRKDKNDGKYLINILINPRNIEFEQKDLIKTNVCLLFKETKDRVIVPLTQYTTDITFHKNDRNVLNTVIHVDESIINGGYKNEKQL